MGMPDLLSTLAEQVQQYSSETLTCALYQMSNAEPEGTTIELVMAAARNRHMPKGMLDARLVCTWERRRPRGPAGPRARCGSCWRSNASSPPRTTS